MPVLRILASPHSLFEGRSRATIEVERERERESTPDFTQEIINKKKVELPPANGGRGNETRGRKERKAFEQRRFL